MGREQAEGAAELAPAYESALGCCASDARANGPGVPMSRLARLAGNYRGRMLAGGRRIRLASRSPAVSGQPALLRQIANRLPGELRGLGVRVLPPIHGRDRDGDLASELLLRHAELLAERAGEIAHAFRHAADRATDVPRASRPRAWPGAAPGLRSGKTRPPAARSRRAACSSVPISPYRRGAKAPWSSFVAHGRRSCIRSIQSTSQSEG